MLLSRSFLQIGLLAHGLFSAFAKNTETCTNLDGVSFNCDSLDDNLSKGPCQKPCEFLRFGQWLEVGQALSSQGDASLTAVVTSDGDVAVMKANRKGISTIVWQASKSDGWSGNAKHSPDQVSTKVDGGQQARMLFTKQSAAGTFGSYGLSVTVGSQVLWTVALKGGGEIPPDSLHLQLNSPGRLQVLNRDNPHASPLWDSGLQEEAEQEEEEESHSPQCGRYFSCEPCIEAGCAWCLARRKCDVDEAWRCDSNSDHVAKKRQFQGQPTSCPTREEMTAEYLRRKAAASEADQERHELEKEAREASTTAGSGEEEDQGMKKTRLHVLKIELERRARWAEEDAGSTRPFEVLGVSRSASPSEIRRAYRKLSLRLHPDKNPEYPTLASQAFADLTKAYGLIGNPDKRAWFEEHGGTDSWDQSKEWRGDESFFYGNPLISTLTTKLWEKRLAGRSIWLVDFYAAWCPHCRSMVPRFEQVAKLLDDGDYKVEVGGMNCVKEGVICSQTLGIRSYPTLALVNREYGMYQQYKGPPVPEQILAWVRDVAGEWEFLLNYGNVQTVNASIFQDVLNTTDMVVVLFTDGLECQPCKTAKTNLMRLSSSLAAMPLQTLLVDCQDPGNQDFCYTEHQIPAPPHRPVLKAWPRLKASASLEAPRGPGEVLFDVNAFESHLALELLERSLRLALQAEISDPGALVHGKRNAYGEDEQDDQENRFASETGFRERPRGFAIQWEGSGRPALNWDGPDHQAKPQPWASWNGGVRNLELQR